MFYDTPFSLWLPGAVVLLLLLRNTYLRCVEELKIRHLGGSAAKFWPWDLWGLYFTYSITSHARRDENLMFMHNCFHKAGDGKSNSDTFEVRMGGARYIMTANLENTKAILATQFDDYGKGKRFQKNWKDLFGSGIFALDGKAWHDSRRRLRPFFTHQRVADLACFERHLQHLLPMFDDEEKGVDVKDLLNRFTMDVSGDYSFGRNLDTINGRHASFVQAFESIRHTQSLIERAGPFNFLIPRGAFKANIRIVEEVIEPSIQEALALPQEALEKLDVEGNASTFVQQCARTSRDRIFLRDEMLGVMLAGRDTTANTLAWTLFELARHPTVVADLRRTIVETVGLNRIPSQAEVKSMKIVSNILNETLRLYPVTPFNVRASLRDTTLPRGGGPDGMEPVGIPAGTTVVYSPHLLHLSPDIYPPCSPEFPPPEQFAPSRWDTWFPKPWTYIPFNGGPRFCIGQAFALTQMSYVLVRVFQQYSKLTLVEDGPLCPSPHWFRVDDEPSIPEKFASSSLQMASELTLAPRTSVNIRFSR